MNQAQSTQDHYATLGVAPRSDAATIRAAYLALMRCYHPDKNDDPAAIGRAQTVIAAFAVLGDAEKRLHYDWDRRRAAEAAAAAQRARPGRMVLALVAAAALLLLMLPVAMMRSPPANRASPMAPTAAVAAVAGDVAEAPDPPAFAIPPAPAPLVAPPLIELEAAVEPPVAVVPRKVEPAPRIAERPAPVPTSRLDPTPRPESPPRPRQLARNAIVPVKPPAANKARCRLVKAGAESAICNDDNLAALDRTAVTFYNQSLSFGDAAKRTALLGARDDFLTRREACRSDSCLRKAHLVHLREISAIVENRPPAPNP